MQFNEYWQTLLKIKNDYNVEQYYDEIIRPLLNESVSEMANVKVIPTFDTRNHKEDREKYTCITGDSENLVWPDYVFVPLEYTFGKPVFPYLKVELKIPNFGMKKEKMVYYPMFQKSLNLYKELKAELIACPLIFTDGVTWMFLDKPEDVDHLDTIDKDKKITFFEEYGKYYSGHYVELSKDASERFEKLKEKICVFLIKSELYSSRNCEVN